MSVRKTTQKKTGTARQAVKPVRTSETAVRKNEAAVVKMPVQAKVSATARAPAQLLKKRELVERVVERTGVKKSDARQVVDAVLAEFGEALAGGRELSVPPLGRVAINREKQIPGGRVFVVKIRQKNISATGSSKDGTEEAAPPEE